MRDMYGVSLPFASEFYFFRWRSSRVWLALALLILALLSNTIFTLADLFLVIPCTFISVILQTFRIILVLRAFFPLRFLCLHILLLFFSSLFSEFFFGSMNSLKRSHLSFRFLHCQNHLCYSATIYSLYHRQYKGKDSP